MYLSKKTFIGANYEHRNIEGEIKLTENKKPINIKKERVSSIEEQVGYWRKANHIHNWFVQNCQEGIDDCRDVSISKEQLLKLLADCKSIKENQLVASEVMPTKSGFFFGGTDYDEGYIQDIDYTIGVVEQILEENGDKEYLTLDIIYSSSW